MKERDILRFEGPLGTFFLREDSDKPIVLLASGTGFAPVKALVEHMIHLKSDARSPVLGRAPSAGPVHGRTVPSGPRAAALQLRAGGLDALPEDSWTAAPASCTRRDAGHPGPVGLPGVCLRRAGDGRLRAHDYVAQCGLPADEFYADAFTTEADLAQP
jgi:CDP-4-dehydro-6-deoxyglucose reductase